MRAVAKTMNVDQSQRRHLLLVVFLFLVSILMTSVALAQPPRTKKKKEEDPKLKPRPVTLKTKDGMSIRSFYFPSEKGKEAVTVLLVHEWRGQGSPYAPLVMALRDAGCAVLVPEYRGHGGSKEYTDSRGRSKTFNITQMSKRDVQNIIIMDLEKSKAFLKEENNDGNLNLNALVVIGVREGCVMAAHWTVRDWSWPSVGRMKQGQDVKALVLISPEKQIKGIAIDAVINNPTLLALPMMVVAGKASPEAEEAERISKRVELVKRKAGGGTVSGFELEMPGTNLSGPSLVNDVSSVIPAIVKFVQEQVPISDDINPWVDRD